METAEQYLQEKAGMVNDRLAQYVESWNDIPKQLKESVAYSLLAGGKRLRPVLVLATAESLGTEAERALPFACALEMIHTYSLIHDDLPAMDDDDYRRGRLTNHKVYGEAMAILAGDALLTKAFGLMAEGALAIGLPGDTALKLIAEASRRAGAEGMVGGQVDDILHENQSVTLETLQSIHRRKTGDLITFSVRLGGMVAGANEIQLEKLTRFAEGLGLAFQIQDDILDVIGDREKLGKETGSDEARNKATYPSLLGLSASKEHLRKTIEEAKSWIEGETWLNTHTLLGLADFLTTRDR
ncbi:farnesyl-diphosphate synthase [Polycladomyces abyssicola]|uniref:Farnesyl diphosphate synthase n=1 Tax=Polycladomyces abyssicola TaxID=1125966 RepID=A0A8D5UE40_9BACL|nr:farnesyl diphosphate synthase [Polycladomyces abyssicola]BCU81597.1 farnesyl-diphosphate synthase [Polycladomyces abyssicola]